MKRINLILFSLLFLLSTQISSITSEKTITGFAKVIDGDSIKINGINIRLFGIDAFELKQSCENWSKHCGKESKRMLEEIIDRKRITCSYREKDRYGRILGICYHGVYFHNDPGLEINGTMVWNGYAIAYKRYSKRFYNCSRKWNKNKK